MVIGELFVFGAGLCERELNVVCYPYHIWGKKSRPKLRLLWQMTFKK